MELNAMFLILPGGWEWIIIVLAILLLFGGRKIPELMKGLGQGMKEFKKARNEASSGDKNKSVDENTDQEENKS
ncbi:twin-arginine translocase TatA/TatE family subunit [Marinilabilia sp.]|jgi:sec-independent protein translocase protein TatA